MADLGAVQRATGQAPGGPPPGPAAPPPGDPGMEAVVGDLTGVKGLIEAQMQAGNPAAEQSMMILQQLVESLQALGGGGEQPPVAPGGPVPLESGVPL